MFASDFLNKAIFLHLKLTSWIQTNLCNCPQHLCLFYILFECNPNKHGQGMMLALPNQLFSCVFFHIGSRFCFFPAILISSTCTDKNRFKRCTKKHSQFETFVHPFSRRTFSSCLSHDSHANRWPYRFPSRGTTGSSTLDHDLGHFVSW